MLEYKRLLFLALFILPGFSNGQAEVFKTQQEALRQTFAGADTVVRRVLFLTDTQVDRIQKLAKARITSKMITYYAGMKTDSTLAYAFFASDIVRTKPATIMVVLKPGGQIASVEILAFHEPMDYLPTPNWFYLFKQKVLNANLWPGRDIHGITGATLSVRSITMGVRKILAIYQQAIREANP